MIKTVLGFDASSTTIGFCVLSIDDTDGYIAYKTCGYLKPLKEGSIISRIVDTRNAIQDIIDLYQPDYIGIEEIIQYMQGKSTAQTIITLTTFNRMICLLCYDYLQREPELFNVMSIRHGLKIGKDLPPKEDMPELVAQHLDITFPYELITKGKNKGKPKVENNDKADATAVALYYAFVLTGKVKRKAKKK